MIIEINIFIVKIFWKKFFGEIRVMFAFAENMWQSEEE